MNDDISWDAYYISMAYMVAMKSKDQGAKLGAVIVTDTNEIISTGFNGFARGLDETIEERLEKPLKLKYTVCAESNAIFAAVRQGKSLFGSTLYVPWCPCNRCTLAIIQSGITTVVTHKDNPHSISWNDEMELSEQQLVEAGVNRREWSGSIIVPRIFKGDTWQT